MYNSKTFGQQRKIYLIFKLFPDNNQRCRKLDVAENNRQMVGSWLSQHSKNWNRKCVKVYFIVSSLLPSRHFRVNLNCRLFINWTHFLFFFSFTAETDPHEGKRINESLWPIFKIHHQKTRYIYDLYFRRKAISRELYDYCIAEKIADANLIAKWKKSGYENLCCLRCIQTRDTNFGTNCICRVPKSKLEEGKIVECIHCGCRGCSG